MKKIVRMLLVSVFMVCMLVPTLVGAAPSTATEKLNSLEQFLYGTTQAGNLKERVDVLEMDVDGSITDTTVLSRIESLYSQVQGIPASGEMSFATKLNAVEWQFSDKIGEGPAKTRIERMESLLNGKVQDDKTLLNRVSSLYQATYHNRNLKYSAVAIPQATLVKIKFLQQLSTEISQAGDKVEFVVAEDVKSGSTMLVPKGTLGSVTVTKVVKATVFGKNARLDLDVAPILAIDGTKLPLQTGEAAKLQGKEVGGKKAVTIGQLVVYGVDGLVNGAFYQGKAAVIPAGALGYLQIAEEAVVNGVIVGK